MYTEKLYKNDSKGNVRVWWVTVDGDTFTVNFGADNGKITQKTTRCKPKNVGKKNETNGCSQAILEATAKHTYQIEREDYHTDITQSGHQLRPMLALDYLKVPKRLNWDKLTFTQPKLDGLRLVVGERDSRHHWNDSYSMISRKGDTYQLDHLTDDINTLVSAIISICGHRYIALDGEAYIHNTSLQTITSYSRAYKPGKTEDIRFYVFDIIIKNSTFLERHDLLLAAYEIVQDEITNIKIVPKIPVSSEIEMKEMHSFYTEHGYEGTMIRPGDSCYHIGNRTDALFKYKEFFDKECIIVGMFQDKNENAVLECLWDHNDTSTTFGCTPKRTHDERKMMLANEANIIGKWITVKYQTLTDAGLPLFPVGMDFRDCDDNGNPLA